MAAALITVTGTSGSILLRYKVSSVPKTLIAEIGTFYIEDTSTDVTYTTLSGDAIATSLIFTIVNLPYKYYNLFWKDIVGINYKINGIILNNIITPFIDVNFPESNTSLINSINQLNIEDVKITDYKFLVTSINNSSQVTVNNSYIFRVLGNSIPELRIKNNDNTGNIYVKGILTTYPVIGYTPVQICNDNILPL
jgi:hypothetical protein